MKRVSEDQQRERERDQQDSPTDVPPHLGRQSGERRLDERLGRHTRGRADHRAVLVP